MGMLHLTHTSRVRAGIMAQDPTYRIVAQNYPLFLWPDNILDHGDPRFGFLQNVLLVKVHVHHPQTNTKPNIA